MELSALILAGGFGRRLKPLTDACPKPMLGVGGKPCLERLVEQLRDSGIHRVLLATHHGHDAIAHHFGDGRRWGVDIVYQWESLPLGTGGAVGKACGNDNETGLLVVVNGDIVTEIDFQSLLDFHRTKQADMTIAVRQERLDLPYGLVETDGESITGIVEKPALRHFSNAGIYVLGPHARKQLAPAKKSRPHGIDELIRDLIRRQKRVVPFLFDSYWRDIGRVEDYERVQIDYAISKEGSCER